jgi:hypothetical protein
MESLTPLRAAYAAVGDFTFGNGWSSHLPAELDADAAAIGIPLLAACSGESVLAAGHMIPARSLNQLAVEDWLSGA